MRVYYLFIPAFMLFLAGCATFNEQGTISELNSVDIDLKDTRIEGGLEKAMASYQHFLNKTPESAMTPEAIRRLADLKVERGYGALGNQASPEPTKPVVPVNTESTDKENSKEVTKKDTIANVSESYKSFEKRATVEEKVKKGSKYVAAAPGAKATDDPETVGARDAIRLYNMLLKKYPLYERNDQVLYQLSRAHEEVGEVEKAMTVMSRLIKQYPSSRYLDEIYFRRAEFYFTRRKYLDAEEAYLSVLNYGVGSVYYERALYKLGWAFYKQDMYEDALKQFITLLDHTISFHTEDPLNTLIAVII